MSIKTVVFDFDGVILESADIKTDAFLELFAEYPEHAAAIRRYHLDNQGISRFNKFDWIYATLLGRSLGAEERVELGASFSRLALEKILACPFVPGAAESLAALSSHIPLYVASGTPEEELRMIAAERGVSQHFKGVYGSPRSKPVILTQIAVDLGIAPAEVLFVGDASSDHEAAATFGCHFLARRTPEMEAYWSSFELPCVDDLSTLPAVVAAWQNEAVCKPLR